MAAEFGRIPEDRLRKLIFSQEIKTTRLGDLLDFFQAGHPPNQTTSKLSFSVDPRSDESIIYSPGRAKRPHDYSDNEAKKKTGLEDCPICAGETTEIIDLAKLSDGYTFINRNLFPVIGPPDFSGSELSKVRNLAWGLHLVQWTSSVHNQDWKNMSEEDCVIVMSRLAGAEEKLLSFGQEINDRNQTGKVSMRSEAYISIIKNFGSAVGGSLEHGHQQLLLSNLAPRRLLDNQRFEKENGATFSEHLQGANPAELLLRDYGKAVLIVSKYMRRPLEMVLALKDTKKSYLHQLDLRELTAVSRGWTDAIGAIHRLMPAYDREVAFNVVTHNGLGAGLYFEFLPYSQEQGGLEQLGLSVCQADPLLIAETIRKILN